MRSVLIFAYYSYKDPVFQSAVLPYFFNFPDKNQYHFILLTFEHEKFGYAASEKEKIRKDLTTQNITWVENKWHSGRFKFAKKAYDLAAGIFKTVRLVKKYKVNCIYSEGFPGAVISHYVARFTKRPHIVHTFEPHTDYMVESGVWKRTRWETVMLRKFESTVAKKAFALMTGTQAMIDKWREKTRAQLYRVPSCVDTEFFQFRESERLAIREKYGIKDHEVVIVYLGKFGGMYMEEEMFDFFKEANSFQNGSYTFRFMVLTPDKKENAESLIHQSGIDPKLFVVENLIREQVPSYLSAADIAFSGVRQNPSKRYCSPIKHGEYWACGLPIIIPDGISDDYLLAEKYNIGWRLPALNREEYDETIKRIFNEWCWEKQTEYRQRARAFVTQDRNVKTYQQLYRRIFSGIYFPGMDN